MKINGLTVKQYLLKSISALNLGYDSKRAQYFIDHYLNDMVKEVKRGEITIDQAVADIPYFIRHMQV